MKRLFNSIYAVVFAVFALFYFSGCENNPTELEDYEPEPVLEAYLYNGEPVGTIKLTRVSPLYSYFDPSAAGISGADVILYPVSVPGDTVHFTNSTTDGIYTPIENVMVQGKVVYRIEVSTPDNEFLYAETTVPDTFTLVVNQTEIYRPNAPIDTLGTFTREMPPLFFMWNTPDSSGGYLGTSVCQTPIDSLIGLDPEWEPEDTVDIPEPSRTSLDMFMSYQNFQEIAWLNFQWVGWHKYTFMAVDKEYFDAVFSYFRAQQGVMVEPLTNIVGGRGIFSGVCKVDFMLYMEKVPE